MIDCISVENMRLSDQQTIAKYVPSLELMGRAANGVFLAVSWNGRVAVMAGSGNNGGDGFILQSRSIECAVFTLSQRLSQDSAHYADRAKAMGVPIEPFQPGQDLLAGYDIVVDCLLGTGFRGDLRDNYRAAIEEINCSGAKVVSVDINSGMNGDTGEASLAVRSDLTVTIGYVKNGLVTENAGAHMKQLLCADIGIVLAGVENKICTEQEWQTLCASTRSVPLQEQMTLSGTTYHRCPDWLDMEPIKAYT